MATKSQIEQALRNADLAGDTEAATMLAKAYSTAQNDSPGIFDTLKHKASVSGRGIVEGLAGVPGGIYNASRIIPNAIEEKYNPLGATIPQPPQSIDTEQYGTKFADMIGLDKPSEQDEIIYPASKSIGSFVLPATAASKLSSSGSAIAKLAKILGGESPLTNIAGITSGTAASEAAKDLGGNEWQQVGANIAGNMASGGILGITKAAGRTSGRTAKAAVGAGLEGVAGRMMHRAAGDESAIVQALLESGNVPTISRKIAGYQPTTSQIAGNAGISTLLRQSGLDVDAATEIANRNFSNTKAIKDYAMKAAGSERRLEEMNTNGWEDVSNIANPMRERNLPVNIAGVKNKIADALLKNEGKISTVTPQLNEILDNLNTVTGASDVAGFNKILNFKQDLDELLRGNAMTNPKAASMQRAASALGGIKSELSAALTASEPGFKDYVKSQALNMKGINQRTAATKFINDARPASPIVSNMSGQQEEVYPISSQIINSLLKNEKKMQQLSPAQARVLDTAQKHAALASRGQAGSMAGSSTAQNFSVKNAVANDLMAAMIGEKPNAIGSGLGAALGIMGKAANPFTSKFGEVNSRALSQIIARAELEPAYAAELMKKYGLGHMNFNDSAGRAALRGAISQGVNQ